MENTQQQSTSYDPGLALVRLITNIISGGARSKGKGNLAGFAPKRDRARAKNKLKFKSKIAQKMKQKGKR